MRLTELAGVPIVRGTSTPTATELADPEKRWALVFVASGRAYLGRLADLTVSDGVAIDFPRAACRLDDPFDYVSGRDVVKRDDGTPGIRMARDFFPVEHFGIGSILVVPESVISLASCPPKQLEVLREALIPAWEGREHLRSHGRAIATVGA